MLQLSYTNLPSSTMKVKLNLTSPEEWTEENEKRANDTSTKRYLLSHILVHFIFFCCCSRWEFRFPLTCLPDIISKRLSLMFLFSMTTVGGGGRIKLKIIYELFVFFLLRCVLLSHFTYFLALSYSLLDIIESNEVWTWNIDKNVKTILRSKKTRMFPSLIIHFCEEFLLVCSHFSWNFTNSFVWKKCKVSSFTHVGGGG